MIFILILSILLLSILTQVIIGIRKMQDQAHLIRMKSITDAKKRSKKTEQKTKQ